MIARDAAIARYEGGRIHVQHVSAAESVEAVERAKADGVRISAEVTPHHLCLSDAICYLSTGAAAVGGTTRPSRSGIAHGPTSRQLIASLAFSDPARRRGTRTGAS